MRPAPPDPPEISRHLWMDVAPGYCGWDIGANCGQTLPEMTARFRQVYAFEPAEECEPYLEPWTRTHGVRLHQCAVSDTTSMIELIALPSKISTGQLVTAGTPGMEWSWDQWDDARRQHSRTVPATSVDQLVFGDGLPRPDFCKIDVEGHEERVLHGAARTVELYRPNFLIEFHSARLRADCANWLDERGYRVDTIRHPHYATGSELWHGHGWLIATDRSDR